MKNHTHTISIQNTRVNPQADTCCSYSERGPTSDAGFGHVIQREQQWAIRHCGWGTAFASRKDQGTTHSQRPWKMHNLPHIHLTLKQGVPPDGFFTLTLLTQDWKVGLLTSQWRVSQDRGLLVLRASQIQVTQFGHQTCPLRVHTTSITTIFQIVLWGPEAPEHLAQMASRLLLEPAQSCLLGLLLILPLVITYLGWQGG